MDEFPNSGVQTTGTMTINLNDNHGPINRIPPEIISQIFLEFLPLRRADGSHFCNSTRLLLGQICSYWRQIVISTQRLWATIDVRLSQKLDTAMVETWLARSGQCLLSLRIGHDHSELILQMNTHPILDAILLHSNRWREVALDLTPAMFFAISMVGTTFPCLQVLAVDVEPPFLTGTHPIDAFELAPIRKLETGLWIDQFTLKLPWTELEEYSAMGGAAEVCLEKLQHSTNLVMCSLRPCRQVIPFICPHILLPRLESLTTHGMISLDHVLDHLSLPALRTFSHIADKDSPATWPNASLIRLLCRSSFQLNTLSLSVILESTDLIECLRYTPNLNILFLDQQGPCCINSTALRLLSDRRSGREGDLVLIPKLGALRFSNYTTTNYCALADMIDSRWNRSVEQGRRGPLLCVWMGYAGSELPELEVESIIEPVALGRLREFQRQGLNIFVSANCRGII